MSGRKELVLSHDLERWKRDLERLRTLGGRSNVDLGMAMGLGVGLIGYLFDMGLPWFLGVGGIVFGLCVVVETFGNRSIDDARNKAVDRLVEDFENFEGNDIAWERQQRGES